MRDKMANTGESSDSENTASLSDDELFYLNAGYVQYTSENQPDADWEYRLKTTTRDDSQK